MRETSFNHDDLRADSCPVQLRDFVTLWVEWETAAGKTGRTEDRFNNRAGRIQIESMYESVCLEAQVLNVELTGVWVRGKRLALPSNDEEAEARRRFLLEHGIPDDDPVFKLMREQEQLEAERTQRELDDVVINPDDDLMRTVVKRDLHIGPKGGEHWRLVLSCGHNFNYSHRRLSQYATERCHKCRTAGSVRAHEFEVDENRGVPGVVPCGSVRK